MNRRKGRRAEKEIDATDDPQCQSGAAAPMPPAQTRLRLSDTYAAPAVCGFLLLIVVLVFGKTFLYDFVNFDDNLYVYENEPVREGLTGAGVVWPYPAGGKSMRPSSNTASRWKSSPTT